MAFALVASTLPTSRRICSHSVLAPPACASLLRVRFALAIFFDLIIFKAGSKAGSLRASESKKAEGKRRRSFWTTLLRSLSMIFRQSAAEA